MKKYLLLLLMILLYTFTAQAQLKFRHHYKIKNTYSFGGDLKTRYAYKQNIKRPMPKKDTTIVIEIVKKVEIKRRNIFGERIINKRKAALTPDSLGKVKIEFWGIKGTDPYKNMAQYVNSADSANNFYFQIQKRVLLEKPISYRSIPYVNTEIGVITIPFKYYFKNDAKGIPNNTSTDINAGVYVGRKWGRQRFYYDKSKNHESVSFTIAAFGGPSKIELKKELVKDTLTFEGDTNELALSLGSGAMLSYRDFNFGLFGGVDLPLSTAGQNWNYANRFWIGFGVGLSLKMLSAAK